MADGDLILTLDATLAQRLRIRAQAAGLSVEAYAHDILRREVDPPGLAESETRWDSRLPPRPPEDDLDQNSKAYSDYIEQICDEAERTGGIPFEVFRERLRNLGQRR